MKITNNTEKLLKCFIDDDGKYKLIKVNNNKEVGKLYKTFYKSINESFLEANVLQNMGEKSIVKINSKEDIPKTYLFNSHYVPNPIKDYIMNYFGGYIKFHLFYKNTNITIFLLLDNNDFEHNIHKYNEYINTTLAWLDFALKYTTLKTNSITLYLFLSDFEKELPKSNINILDTINCNSAVTTACNKDGEILIYRKEEWMKVLMHETIHLLCLDFSGMDYYEFKQKIKSLYPINSDFELSESYSEFWANTINSFFISYILLDDKKNYDSFVKYYSVINYYEKLFALFQCLKILEHMNLTYEMLYKRDELSMVSRKLYKENTNVFPYYILKMVLLYHKEDFMIWCRRNNEKNVLNYNKTPQTFNSLFLFIKSKMDNIDMLDDLDTIRIMFRREKNSNNCEVLLKTTRMSLFDLN